MALLAGGLVGGYLAALLLFRLLGGLIGSATGLPGVVTYPFAGMAVLFAVSGVISHYARRHRKERAFKIENGWEPPPSDRMGGMALGGAYGVAIALIIAWAGMSLGGLYGGREMQTIRNSATARASTVAVQRAISVGARAVVVDHFVASSIGRMVADPFSAIGDLNGVMALPDMQALLGSGALQQAARLQDARALAAHPALVALAGDENFASAMRTFGLLGAGSGPADPTQIAEAIIREAGPALRSVDALASDPEVSAILSSADFRDTWEQGDFMRMAQGADFRRLFDRVLVELRRSR